MDKVAIVILNWNGAKMMRQYLPTVDGVIEQGIPRGEDHRAEEKLGLC